MAKMNDESSDDGEDKCALVVYDNGGSGQRFLSFGTFEECCTRGLEEIEWVKTLSGIIRVWKQWSARLYRVSKGA